MVTYYLEFTERNYNLLKSSPHYKEARRTYEELAQLGNHNTLFINPNNGRLGGASAPASSLRRVISWHLCYDAPLVRYTPKFKLKATLCS